MDPAALKATAQRMVLEHHALEAFAALEAAGVGVRLLKGMALAHLLYEPGENRTYVDVDLLVDPGKWDRAGRVLVELGYEPAPAGGIVRHAVHAVTFCRVSQVGGRVEIDLHHRIHGARVSSRAVWRVASSDPVTVPVGVDASVLTTNLAVTLFHLTVSALPENFPNARHPQEWRRCIAKHPDLLPAARDVAARWRAENMFDRAVAYLEDRGVSEVPAPTSPRVRSIACSAWLRHLRRAPSLRARLELIHQARYDFRARTLR